jgi:hypothetical protein
MLCNSEHSNFAEHNRTVFKFQCESASSTYPINLVTYQGRVREGLPMMRKRMQHSDLFQGFQKDWSYNIRFPLSNFAIFFTLSGVLRNMLYC